MGKLFYEDLVKEENKRKGQKPESLAKQAIAARGGHCQKCPRSEKLIAISPSRISHPPTAAELSVQVKCSVDQFRKYPFQSTTLGPDACPSFKKHLKRQKQISE